MEQEEKKPQFSLENAVKSWFTTLMGCAVMGVCFYGWYHTKNLSDWQALIGSTAGFALLFMRDALPGFITRIFNKKIDQ